MVVRREGGREHRSGSKPRTGQAGGGGGHHHTSVQVFGIVNALRSAADQEQDCMRRHACLLEGDDSLADLSVPEHDVGVALLHHFQLPRHRLEEGRGPDDGVADGVLLGPQVGLELELGVLELHTHGQPTDRPRTGTAAEHETRQGARQAGRKQTWPPMCRSRVLLFTATPG